MMLLSVDDLLLHRNFFYASADSPPPSAESSFRELDDVFLQTQTRIWLGQVLHSTLHDQLTISDLLADGELLFEVSREIWKMLLRKGIEPRYMEVYKYEPFASRRCSGRYTPYSNVDSFLKICKFLGLDGIDLFSPSDVVERRNIRKVCMCIRSLSKKARSRELNVPDFDIVSYTITMPKDMVGGIRRSWELSGSSSSSPSSHILEHESTQKQTEKYSTMAAEGNYLLHFKESDDTESNCTRQSNGSTVNSFHNTLTEMNSGSENSLEEPLATKNSPFNIKYSPHQLDFLSQQKGQHAKFQLKEVSLNEPMGSVYWQHMEDDYQPDAMLSPSSVDSNAQSYDRVHCKGEGTNILKNYSLNLIPVDHDLEDCASVIEGSMDVSCSKPSEQSHSHVQSAWSDSICLDTYTGESITIDGESSAESHYAGLKATRMTVGNKFTRTTDVDDEEISSVATVGSMSGDVLNFDIADHSDDCGAFYLPVSPSNREFSLRRKSVEGSESHDPLEFEAPGNGLMTGNKEAFSLEIEATNSGFSSNHTLYRPYAQLTTGYSDNVLSRGKDIYTSQVYLSTGNWEREGSFTDQSCYSSESRKWDQKGKSKLDTVLTGSIDQEGSSPHVLHLDSCKEILHFCQCKKGARDTLQLENIKPVNSDENMAFLNPDMVDKDPNSDAAKQLSKHSEALSETNIDERHMNMGAPCPDYVTDLWYQIIVNSGHRFLVPGITYDQHNAYVSCILGEATLDKDTWLTSMYSQRAIVGNQILTGQEQPQADMAEHMNQVQNLAVEHIVGAKEGSEGIPEVKRQTTLLKSVAKGTAVLGVLLLLARLRRSGRKRSGGGNEEAKHEWREKSRKSTSAKVSKGYEVYPSEKLKLKA
ncbi:hypothetical protein K2173_011960 [Erythroxylum novogranatense]|uniref:Calponin-homology (CH) domain-containing protein n=1 Tax=Erythroxylum novogranatense TaxID=1862640 RepID=A0AAV8TG67_9ROSI|nr:hypothetical protein K2173_011960 [Erythroxylum novogranatense]